MIKYVLQRIGAMLLTLFLVMVLSFMIIRLMPMSIFENPEVSPEIQYKLEEEMHLHDPIPVQLFYFLKNIVVDFNDKTHRATIIFCCKWVCFTIIFVFLHHY